MKSVIQKSSAFLMVTVKNNGMFLMIFALAFVGLSVRADDAPAAPTYLDGILAWMSQPQAIVATIVSLLEVGLRVFKTKIPLSVLIPIKYAVDGVGKILSWISANLIDALIKMGNNVG